MDILKYILSAKSESCRWNGTQAAQIGLLVSLGQCFHTSASTLVAFE